MSRITYTNGKLYLSLTRSECEEAYKNKGKPVELDIGNLKVLHEDISKVVAEYWSDVEVKQELSYLKGKDATQDK